MHGPGHVVCITQCTQYQWLRRYVTPTCRNPDMGTGSTHGPKTEAPAFKFWPGSGSGISNVKLGLCLLPVRLSADPWSGHKAARRRGHAQYFINNVLFSTSYHVPLDLLIYSTRIKIRLYFFPNEPLWPIMLTYSDVISIWAVCIASAKDGDGLQQLSIPSFSNVFQEWRHQ